MRLLPELCRAVEKKFRFHLFASWKKPPLLIFAPLMAFNFNYGLEDTNILTYDEAIYAHDFNRLRFEGTLEHSESPLRAKLLLDNKTSSIFQQSELTNSTEIYRAYLEYAGEKHFVVLGRQRVPFGVGRIWNPIDVFNPIDSFSVEPVEREGTEALHYEYAVNDLSNLDLTVSKKKNAARIKGFFHSMDLALIGVADSENDRDIIGYEAAGELLDTNIELRSEGGSFYNRNTEERSSEFIVGADYGFQNSFTVLGEYRFNDESQTDYLGISLSYQPAPLVYLTLLHIIQLNDASYFTAPAIEYSLGDDMTLKGGALLYNGDSSDEFGSVADSYYLNFYVHF